MQRSAFPDLQDSTASLPGQDERPGIRQRDEPYFLVIDPSSSAMFRLPSKPEFTIGRGLDADLQLQHSSVSRTHARLRWHGDALWIQDAGSHNGVRVNGVRIHEPQILASGDVVQIGEVVLILHCQSIRSGQRPVLDRAAARQYLVDEIERALRYHHPLLLLHIDLGVSPSEPDMLTAALGQHLRPLDRLARLGASELAVILPDCEEDEAHDLIERLLRELPQGARIGTSSCPVDGGNADMLLFVARQAAAAAAPGAIADSASIQVRRQIGEHAILLAEPAMLRVYELISRLGPSSIPVLIHGETGSGKEIAAAALHHASPRSSRRFLAINCAALPESLAESELFGHERGAFSGAVATKSGLLESAQGGTVFLDEIGELSLPVQAKLLRALETRRILRVGDVHERPIDVRVLAATHRDLEADARAGRFRQDLYFRLAAAVVNLPALRHRPVELPLLARCFLREARERLGATPLAISNAAMWRIVAYDWPGNIRELRNAMEFLAATVQEPLIETWHLPAKLGGPQAAAPSSPIGAADALSPSSGAALSFRPLEAELREIERTRMQEALIAAEGSQTRAAELLGMPRRTFFAKKKQYGLGLRGSDTADNPSVAQKPSSDRRSTSRPA